MANNYDNILLKLAPNQVFSATLHYQSKEKKHRLAFQITIRACGKGDHSLGEISEILVDDLIEKFNHLQHRSISWTHMTLRFQSNYPNETYRINIPTINGRLDGTFEERCAIRFEFQEAGTVQTRWMNLFGSPKSVIIPTNDPSMEINSMVNYIESVILGRPIGKEILSLSVLPAPPATKAGTLSSRPLSCNCRGVHVFQPVKKRIKEPKIDTKTINRR